MKQQLRTRLLRRGEASKWRQWLRSSRGKTAGTCGAAALAGFVLAGAQIGGVRLPLALGLTASLGLSIPAFASYVGSCVGALVLYGWTGSMEPMAAGLLTVATACIFTEHGKEKNPWFAPLCAALYTGLVGFLFLLEQRFAPAGIWQWALRIAAAIAAARLFQRFPGGERWDRLWLYCCLCCGLCAVRLPGGLPVGAAAAAALTVFSVGTELSTAAAACLGLTLDLAWTPMNLSAVFLLANLAAGRMHRRLFRGAVWLGCVLLGVLLTDGSYLAVAAALPGAVAACFLRKNRLFGAPEPSKAPPQRLRLMAELLQEVGKCLQGPRREKPEPEMATVFDQAAERVCRLCIRWDTCWGEQAQETYLALERAAVPMMARGKAIREDFPASFSGQCRHMEGLLHAVNRELDDLSCRRQYRSRLRESRTVLAQQYESMAKALSQPEPEKGAVQFRPEIGFRSQGRRDDTVSGDRGASFRYGGSCYILLCDGMGTGRWARAEAEAAIEILRHLLQAGVPAAEALQTLNGVYILRDDGGFATVDLLQADLQTGEAVLYKWGAASSYLKSEGKIRRLEAETMPPGVGPEQSAKATGLHFSMANGEILVMVSDGVEVEAAERCIRQYAGRAAKELASGVIEAAAHGAQDDKTAVAVWLQYVGQ